LPGQHAVRTAQFGKGLVCQRCHEILLAWQRAPLNA
jgi:hypothetical protein